MIRIFILLSFIFLISCSNNNLISKEEIKSLVPDAKEEKLNNMVVYYSPSKDKFIFIGDKKISFQGDITFVVKGLKTISKNEKAIILPHSVATFKRNGKNWVCTLKIINNMKTPYNLTCIQDDSLTCKFYRNKGISCAEF